MLAQVDMQMLNFLRGGGLAFNFFKGGGEVVEKNKEVGSNIKTPSTRWKVAKNLSLFTTNYI